MSQSDHGATFDQDFQITLSQAEHDAFFSYCTSQGLSDQDAEDAITTLETARTAEYHHLNDIYGKLGDTFNPNYRYQTALTQTFDASAVNAGAITLVGNVFQTGQAIVYHGTSNAVLVDGQTLLRRRRLERSVEVRSRDVAGRRDRGDAAPAREPRHDQRFGELLLGGAAHVRLRRGRIVRRHDHARAVDLADGPGGRLPQRRRVDRRPDRRHDVLRGRRRGRRDEDPARRDARQRRGGDADRHRSWGGRRQRQPVLVLRSGRDGAARRVERRSAEELVRDRDPRSEGDHGHDRDRRRREHHRQERHAEDVRATSAAPAGRSTSRCRSRRRSPTIRSWRWRRPSLPTSRSTPTPPARRSSTIRATRRRPCG